MTVQAPAAKTPFSLFGVEIRIEASVLILAGVVGWTIGTGELQIAAMTGANVWLLLGVVILGLGLSVLLHEMGHTLVGRAFGMKIDRITLHVFGGVAQFSRGPKTAVSELLMALAGPAVSVLLAGVFWILWQLSPGDTLPRAFHYLTQMNLVLALFNMAPAFPMDGGRVLRSLIWMFTGKVRLATTIAATLGVGLGLLLVAAGVGVVLTGGGVVNGVWMAVMGLMIANIARASRPKPRLAPAVPTGG